MTPAPRTLWQFPAQVIGRQVHVYDSVPSTNDLAARLADDPANAGIAVLAAEQTAGRGQHGRHWLASPGQSVLMSVLVFPPEKLRRPALLTAWAAVSVARLAQRLTGTPAIIKWPNDVLVGSRKICGILIESTMSPRREPHAVVGMGLNVRQSPTDFSRAGLTQATSLAAVAGREFETEQVASLLLAELDGLYRQIADGELASFQHEWRERLGLWNHDVIIELTDGSHRAGRLIALGFDGLELIGTEGPQRFEPELIRHVTRDESASQLW